MGGFRDLAQGRETAEQETRAEILEGAGRAVKQFQDLQARLIRVRLHQWGGKVEGIGADRRGLSVQRGARKEGAPASRRPDRPEPVVASSAARSSAGRASGR